MVELTLCQIIPILLTTLCLLETLWKKEKMLVSSIFSFLHNTFFYPMKDKQKYLSNIHFVICKCFQFRCIQNLSFGEEIL